MDGERGVIFQCVGGVVRIVSKEARTSDRAAQRAASPFTTVLAMACIGSSRLCAHVEKLCQYGHFTQLRRKVSTTTCAKSRSVDSRLSGALLKHCQVRFHTETPIYFLLYVLRNFSYPSFFLK